jgi:hypothetical protein
MFFNKEANCFEMTQKDLDNSFQDLERLLDGETITYIGGTKIRQSLAAWYRNYGYIHPKGMKAFDYLFTHTF